MRHRQAGRKFGRNPKHQRALLRSLACALILTERDLYGDKGEPKAPGRIITTLEKAKEMRPFVERCITIAKRVLPAMRAAEALEPAAEPRSSEYTTWRKSEQGAEWVKTVAPVVAARRHVLKLLHNKEAVGIIFEKLAARFEDRPGGYTRILRLATPRLGDGGKRAIIEFVGRNDRVAKRSERPVFEAKPVEEKPVATENAVEETPVETTENAAE